MALCGAAGIWTAFWVVAGRGGQTPNDAAGVRTHIENNVFELDMAWRDVPLRFASGVRPFRGSFLPQAIRLLNSN